MKDINLYITEKLRLNNDIKISTYMDDILNDILDFCKVLNIKPLKKIEYPIKKWIEENSIKAINMYVQNNTASKKYLSKIDNDELLDKIKILEFDKFLTLFAQSFTNKLLYQNNSIDIYGNDKALSIQLPNFYLLVIKQ